MACRIDQAIEVIREFSPPAAEPPLHVAFSGGKDSIVLLDLVRQAGVPHVAKYNNTTIDPPELAKFLRQVYPEVAWTPPKRPFFVALLTQGYPTRAHRWCCRELKEERIGDAKVIATGVRKAESSKRARRQVVEACLRHPGVRYVNPILEWSDEEVWSYIHDRKLAYCSLYDEGWKRIGCVLCPQASQQDRAKQAERWPKFVVACRAAFRRMWERKMASPKTGKSWSKFRDGDELFDWWLWFTPPASRLAEAAAAAAAKEQEEEEVEEGRIFLSDDA